MEPKRKRFFVVNARAHWEAATTGESLTVALLLVTVFVMSLAWAMLSKRVPDEGVYFSEILQLASTGNVTP